MSKLSDYLAKQKIDPRRVLVASKKIEAMRPEDRAVAVARRKAKAGDEAAKELAAKARRSGRPVTRPELARAMRGDALSRGARQRVVRAVNAVLEQKKRTAVGSGDLF